MVENNETDLINGCIYRKVSDGFVPSFHDYIPEEVNTLLGPNFVLCGWLNPEPPKKKLRLSLKTTQKLVSSSRFAVPVSKEQFTEAVKEVVP